MPLDWEIAPEPFAVKFMIEMVPRAAATLPSRMIEPLLVVSKSKVLPLPAADVPRLAEIEELLRNTFPAAAAEIFALFVSTRADEETPMSPDPASKVTVDPVSTPPAPNIDPDPSLVSLRFAMVPVVAATLPCTVMEPLLAGAVTRSKVRPLPAEEAFKVTAAANSLINTLAEVLADRIELLINMRAAVDRPRFPEVEARLTVDAVRVPEDTDMLPEPSAVKLMVAMVPEPAAKFPLITIDPLLPAAVIRSKILAFPADDGNSLTTGAALLRKTLPVVLAESISALERTRAAEDAPMSPLVDASVTVEAVNTPAPPRIDPDPPLVKMISEMVPLAAVTLP
jgi:hypothetical protein